MSISNENKSLCSPSSSSCIQYWRVRCVDKQYSNHSNYEHDNCRTMFSSWEKSNVINNSDTYIKSEKRLSWFVEIFRNHSKSLIIIQRTITYNHQLIRAWTRNEISVIHDRWLFPPVLSHLTFPADSEQCGNARTLFDFVQHIVW